MLLRQIERLKRSNLLANIIVATSLAPDDDLLAAMCADNNIECFRGDLADVLDRYYRAAVKYKARHVARLTGDCPLTDPKVIDHVIEVYSQSHADYATNALEPTYPDGLDVEVFSFKALEKAWNEARLPSEREHVTPYIHKHPELFNLKIVKHTENLSALRWTVDNPEDFAFVKQVYEALYPVNPEFGTEDILNLMGARPDLVGLNAHLVRNEGYQKSIALDAMKGVDRNA
jgi:spore coat polysaccharide biosynthesis protein SpsF